MRLIDIEPFESETDVTTCQIQRWHSGEVYQDVVTTATKDIPTIEAEPVKHGRWVWDENAMDWGLGGWICSECQEKNDNIPAKPDIYPSGWVGSHYCPNCGAKMNGGVDNGSN